jgi:hypothetical protein
MATKMAVNTKPAESLYTMFFLLFQRGRRGAFIPALPATRSKLE